MRISDWSSDVCSSDRHGAKAFGHIAALAQQQEPFWVQGGGDLAGQACVVLGKVAARQHEVQAPALPHGRIRRLHEAVVVFGSSEGRRVGKGCVSTFRTWG